MSFFVMFGMLGAGVFMAGHLSVQASVVKHVCEKVVLGSTSGLCVVRTVSLNQNRLLLFLSEIKVCDS